MAPKVKIRVCGIAIEEDSTLLIRHDYPNERPLWHIPGGGVAPNELLTDAVKRELIEELGLPVVVGDLWFVCNSIRSNDGGYVFHLVFDIQRAFAHHPQLQPQHTIAQVFEWVPIHRLSTMRLYPNIGPQLCQFVYKRSAFMGTQNLWHVVDIG